jgi:hypothetical protein
MRQLQERFTMPEIHWGLVIKLMVTVHPASLNTFV